MATTITYSNDEQYEVVSVSTIAAATTLTAANSGNTYVLSAAAGAAINLPALKSGLKFKFVVGSAFATTNWTIVCPSAIGQGGAIVNSVNVPAANETTIALVATAETIGDWLEILCDGTNYYINGVGTAVGAITFV